MPRFARRLLALCSAASLLLCVGVCLLWVRSYWRTDLYARDGQPPNEGVLVGSSDGRLVVRREMILPPFNPGLGSLTKLVAVLERLAAGRSGHP